LSISVAHLPPSTSKWKRVKQHLLVFTAQNWRGKPLLTHQIIVQLIASTITQISLTVQYWLDENAYEVTAHLPPAHIFSIDSTA